MRGERENLPFYLLIPSPNGNNSGIKELLPGLSNVGVVAGVIGAFYTAFPGTLAGSWVASGAAGTQTNTHMGCWNHRRQLYT